LRHSERSKTRSGIALQDETGEILAQTTQPNVAQPGDRVEVLGFLGLGRYT